MPKMKTRELFFLNSAEAKSPAFCEDFDRPLKMRGKRAAQCAGLWLARKNLIPDLIISSPAARTLATAQKCCKTMGISVSHIWKDSRLYHARQDDILSVLTLLNSSLKRVLLVGHSQSIRDLLNNIKSVAAEKSYRGLKPSTLVRLDIQGTWEDLIDGGANIVEMVPASSLQKKFPYPDIESKRWRNRPAYYYTQSGVLPYRIHQGKLEILIVSSRNNKRWILPKGIVDPGLTPQQSAVKEAYEEAGIEGRIDTQKLGDYQYHKWGAKCHVDIYPFEVQQLISEEEWEENHRTRIWTSAKKAAKMLASPENSSMIHRLKQKLTTTS